MSMSFGLLTVHHHLHGCLAGPANLHGSMEESRPSLEAKLQEQQQELQQLRQKLKETHNLSQQNRCALYAYIPSPWREQKYT